MYVYTGIPLAGNILAVVAHGYWLVGAAVMDESHVQERDASHNRVGLAGKQTETSVWAVRSPEAIGINCGRCTLRRSQWWNGKGTNKTEKTANMLQLSNE